MEHLKDQMITDITRITIEFGSRAVAVIGVIGTAARIDTAGIFPAIETTQTTGTRIAATSTTEMHKDTRTRGQTLILDLVKRTKI